MQSETGFPSSHQLKSYVASKSRLKLAARAVLSADAGLLVNSPVRSRPHIDDTVFEIQDGGCHFEKSLNRHNAATVQRIAMKFGIMTQLILLSRTQSKFRVFKTPRRRTAAVFQNRKIAISQQRFDRPMAINFCTMTHNDALNCTQF